MIGRPIFDYPPERRAPEGEGCATCGIVLEGDAIDGHCSPECYEWKDRCAGCQRGPTWCDCEVTHCIDCGEPLPARDVERALRTCRSCAQIREQIRFDLGPSRRRPQDPPIQNIPIRSELGRQIRQSFLHKPAFSKPDTDPEE